MDMQYIKLNNGIEMPQIGLGHFLYRRISWRIL